MASDQEWKAALARAKAIDKMADQMAMVLEERDDARADVARLREQLCNFVAELRSQSEEEKVRYPNRQSEQLRMLRIASQIEERFLGRREESG